MDQLLKVFDLSSIRLLSTLRSSLLQGLSTAERTAPDNGVSRKFLPALTQLTAVIGLLCDAFLAVTPATALEPNYKSISTPRFAVHVEQTRAQLANYDNEYAANMAEQALGALEELHGELVPLFEGRPIGQVVVRFLSEDTFYGASAAPAWTSALFSRGEIRIPVSRRNPLHPDEFDHTLRHEYIHAIIAQLTNYRCPAWLDEGLAQLIEGRHSPRLIPALRRRIVQDRVFSLSALRRGFTSLDRRDVPAAYAQSLFAVQSLIDEFGFTRVLDYLDLLHSGAEWSYGFEQTFGYTVAEFEQLLTGKIRRWAASDDRPLLWASLPESNNRLIATTVSTAAAVAPATVGFHK